MAKSQLLKIFLGKTGMKRPVLNPVVVPFELFSLSAFLALLNFENFLTSCSFKVRKKLLFFVGTT